MEILNQEELILVFKALVKYLKDDKFITFLMESSNYEILNDFVVEFNNIVDLYHETQEK